MVGIRFLPVNGTRSCPTSGTSCDLYSEQTREITYPPGLGTPCYFPAGSGVHDYKKSAFYLLISALPTPLPHCGDEWTHRSICTCAPSATLNKTNTLTSDITMIEGNAMFKTIALAYNSEGQCKCSLLLTRCPLIHTYTHTRTHSHIFFLLLLSAGWNSCHSS